MTRKIAIFDTTLRDGEQSPGASMNTEEKLIIARQLVRMNVDVIEAGFPISSPGDFKSVYEIGKIAGDTCTVCGLTRAVDKDIEVAAEALKSAKRPRIHTGLGVSPSHLRDKLHLTEDEAIERAIHAVKYARNFVDDVEFYAEDAGRSDQEFLVRIIQAAVKAGATVVNIPDTTGYNMPWNFGTRIKDLRERVDGIENVTISVHTHNDLGMATALALDAVQNGATQIECTINGLGERAGASRLVSSITGINVQPNKAIVGANAFAHSSGIHQDGVLKARDTYEIIDPADVGAAGSEIILSARSGHAALRHRLGELGYTFDDTAFEDVYNRFLEIADQKKEVFDEDLESMVQERQREVKAIYTLDALQVSCGDPLVPTATATISDELGVKHVVCATGTGPVDAAYKAVDKVVAVHGDLAEFSVKAISRGIDAIGEVTVRITAEDGKVYTGRGADTDIIVSSAKAYVNAVNRMIQTARSKEGK